MAMNLKVFSPDGGQFTEREFPIPVFEGEKGLKALRQVILAYEANQRLGTHSTLNHRTVHGTGKKPFPQKGSGRARQGSRNGNQHYHGGTWKGPKPRDYSQKLNKKMRVLALSRALFDRASAGQVDLIERWDVAEAKTKLFTAVLDRIQPAGKVLIVDEGWTDTVAMAARNIDRLAMAEAAEVTARDLCHYTKIIMSEKSLAKVLARVEGGQS